MIIEKTPLKLKPLNLSQVKVSGVLIGLKNSRKMKLSQSQMEYLELLSRGKSIYDISQAYLARNVLISFNELYNLVVFLAEEDLLINRQLVDYLYQPQEKTLGFFEDIVEKYFSIKEEVIEVKKEIKENPFFRTLTPPIVKLFLDNASGAIVAKNISICREGQEQRSLYVLLRGKASVYKTDTDGVKKKVATLTPGSVFGEAGFFLDEPRTADVVSDEECVVAKIKYVPEVFDDLIKKDKANHLKKRFWMIHALLRSELFNKLPTDCFDALLFSGEFKNFSNNEKIINENDMGYSCYIVVQGKVRVIKNGKEVRVLGQGDAFGEVALILNKGLRTATIEAITDVVLLEIPAKNLYQLMSENLLMACLFEKAALLLVQGKPLV